MFILYWIKGYWKDQRDKTYMLIEYINFPLKKYTLLEALCLYKINYIN